MDKPNNICDVPGCSRKWIAGWSPKDAMEKTIKVCEQHVERHTDKEDSFSFWGVIGMRKPKTGKEELLEAGIKVSKLASGGTEVRCGNERCRYRGRLIAEVSDLSKIECPECGGKLEGVKEMAKRKKKKVRVKRAKKKARVKAQKKAARKSAAKRPTGKTSGVGIIDTWIKLLTTPKLSDAEISKQMKKEFPGRKSKIFDQVQVVRNRYNKGALTKGKIPKKQSVQLDKPKKKTKKKATVRRKR